MSSACKNVLAALLASAAIAAAAPAVAQNAHGAVDPHHGWNQFPIEVLSGRPDAISGGDALVRITVKKNVALNQTRIKLNGTDVTSAFVANGAARTLTGLVTGLKVGENLLEAIDPRGNVQGKGRADADIVLTNYPIEGPVFSGPHEQPFACATQQFTLPGGLGNLGAPLDANCHDQPARGLLLQVHNEHRQQPDAVAGRRDRLPGEPGAHQHHDGDERAVHRAH